VGEAARASDEAAVDALLSQGQQAEARCEVVGAYLIDVTNDNPVEVRERIRAFGPTVQTPTP
jgi:hypothetical protein